MGYIAVSNRVIARNGIGRFIAECEIAGTRTVQKLIKRGERLSKDFAPRGHKHDPRTIPLVDSIESRMTGRTSGEWYATARHALPQEKGAAPHVIAGSPHLRFFWDEQGRMFVPAEEFYGVPGAVTMVNHPGNPPQPYLRPAYEIVMREAMRVADREYPG